MDVGKGREQERKPWRELFFLDRHWLSQKGSVKTLDEAVRVMASVQLNQQIDSTQAGDNVEFLYMLTGEFPRQDLPQLPSTPGRSLVDQ